jgi:L-iditol 2-dehydrogenase
MLTRAGVYNLDGRFTIGDYEIGECGPDEIVVRVERTAICKSDWQWFLKNLRNGFEGSRRYPGDLGLVMGHETSGTVVAVGANVTGIKVGDKVALDSTVYCNNCRYCRAGMTNLCTTRQVLGVAPKGQYHRNGAFADHVIVPHYIAHKMAEGVSFTQGAMMEPAAVAHAGWNLGKVMLEQDVPCVIIGAGNIAKLAMQITRYDGFKFIAVNRGQTGLDQAAVLGAEQGFLLGDPSIAQQIAKLTDGGPMAILDFVGTQQSYDVGLSFLGDGGRFVVIGDEQKESKSPHLQIVKKQWTVMGSCAFPASSIKPCLDMIAAGALDVTSSITNEIGLNELPEAFDHLAGDSRDPAIPLKYVVDLTK